MITEMTDTANMEVLRAAAGTAEASEAEAAPKPLAPPRLIPAEPKLKARKPARRERHIFFIMP